jgi:hypothetical protein
MPDPIRRNAFPMTYQQTDPGTHMVRVSDAAAKQQAIDTSATNRSLNSKQAEPAHVTGDQDIRVPLVSSSEAPEALPDERGEIK